MTQKSGWWLALDLLESERDRLRAAAPRKARLVLWGKRFLSFLALAVIIMVALWLGITQSPLSQQLGSGDQANNQGIVIGDDEMIRVNAPRYIGLDPQKQPIIVTADYAAQLSLDHPVFRLSAPRADMTLRDGTWIAIHGEEGIYDEPKNEAMLKGDVEIFHDAGHEIRGRNVVIDLNQNKASSQDPVKAHGPLGQIEAEGFEIENRGAKILFTGHVKLVILPQKDQ